VRKLKDAGAVVLGKTAMPDWAASWFSTSSRSGTTKHPIDASRDPGGSSSGSGTAVASNMALMAIGGDTGGSIRLPASFCGLTGVRVTPGRISRHGMSSLVKTQDTPGPMCHNLEDAARLLDVLVGFDEKDDFTSINAFATGTTSSTPFVDAIRQPRLQGKRLGVLRQAFGTHEGINRVLESTLADLQSAGAELIEVEIPGLERLVEQTSVYILRSRFDIHEFCTSRDALKHLKIEELQASGTYHEALDLINALVKGPSDPYNSWHFSRALVEIQTFQRVVASIFAKQKLDCIVYPTCQLLAPKTEDVLNMR
jgi:Asp-tRNA(Asn)/Glu-tRNA(Gln) amidotransferase A subunit family amidase